MTTGNHQFTLLLSVLLSIPLGMKATIVDDPGVFNFSPFYDPSSGVIGLALTFFPSEEGDTVYIPDYIYENNQYKYVVCINTGAFFDCNAKYIRLPNHLRFIRDNAFHYCCFLTTLEFTNDISEIDFGEIDDIVGGCNYVDEIIVPLEYLGNYIDDPEDRFFPFFLYEQLKSKVVLSDYNKMIWADVNFKISGDATPFYCTSVNHSNATATRSYSVNVVPANKVVCLEGNDNDVVYPNEAGHLFVAWKFLEQQNAPGVVSDVEIDYSSARMTRAQNADVSNVRILPDGRLSFAVLEGALPMPIPPRLEKFAHDAGLCESLNREIVSIKNLPEGQWTLFIDGEKAMTASAEAFAKGVNLSCADTPQHRQAEAVRAANARRFGELDYVLGRCRLARWALNRRTEVNPDDLTAVQAYRDGLPEAQRRKWPWVALDPYLENWARRKEIMSEIERRHGEIRKMARPVQHAFELRCNN